MEILKTLFCCFFRNNRVKKIVVRENEFTENKFTEEELRRGYTYIML